MKHFLVLSSSRTGSTLLTKCLEPYCAGEIWTHPSHIGWGVEESRKDPYRFFKQRIAKYPGMFGAKLQTLQLEQMRPFADGYNQLFSAIESAIFLRRRNLTEQALSDTIMRRFKAPIGKGIEQGPLSFDIDNLKQKSENWVSWYNRWSAFVQTKCRLMTLWYEDLDQDIAGVSNKVRQFLGLPDNINLDHGMKKLRSSNKYSKIISNYDEIVQEMGAIYGVPFGESGTRWNNELSNRS